jgi:hypothetical protein
MGRPNPDSVIKFPARYIAVDMRDSSRDRRRKDHLFGFWMIIMGLLIYGFGVFVGASFVK